MLRIKHKGYCLYYSLMRMDKRVPLRTYLYSLGKSFQNLAVSIFACLWPADYMCVCNKLL